MFTRARVPRPSFIFTALVAAAAVHGQSINVTAANASNDAIYSVSFNNNGGGSITVLNTDGGSLHNLTSLVFLPNPSTFQLDLLAADNQGGLIVRYPGDFHSGSPTTGSPIPLAGGPAYPDGLSVDPAGDLFVVNSKPGSSSNPQLWALPAASGGFGTPVLLDSTYGASEVLMDTLIASSSAAQPVVNPGDLLVLTSSPGQVLLYPGSNGNGPVTPCTPSPAGCVPATAPTILITLPAGTIPGGLAFWPPDNSLLITTTRGTILQYHFPAAPGDPVQFASGLGNGQFKIKTGIQFGLPYAYVANNNGGDILEFGFNNKGVVTLLATVTSGVQHPQGLAVTNTAYAPVANCENQLCDLLGGQVIRHDVPNLNLQVPSNVVENVCVVQTDPRIALYQTCTGHAQSVNQVCPGFDNTNTLLIPDTLCGSSGATGHGFALVKTLAQAYTQAQFPFNGSLVFTDSLLDNILPPAKNGNNPLCNPAGNVAPLGTIVYAPLPEVSGEGLGAGYPYVEEVTNNCDGSGSNVTHLSLFAVGLALNNNTGGNAQSFLVSYTAGKYPTLINTIAAEAQAGALAPPLAAGPGTFTYKLQQCIKTSQAAFGAGTSGGVVTSTLDLGGAANELLAADQTIAQAAAHSTNFTPIAPGYPNPSGELRMYSQNAWYRITTDLLLQTVNPGPPSSPPAPPPPIIKATTPPATMVKAGSQYPPFQPTATDFTGTNDGAPLTFSIAGAPSWATFDPMSGTLSGIAQKGTYPGIVITVTDGCASASLPPFTIKVTG